MTIGVSALSPKDANLWLMTHGWRRLNEGSSIAAFWHRDDSNVIVPMNLRASDFIRRWDEMLTTVSSAHEISPSTLRTAFLYEGADVSEWRAAHSHLIDHTIPVTAAHTLLGSVKSSIVAAASATISPRGYFGHSVPKRAREAADIARVGQTREGSYVIPIISRLPVPDAPVRDTLDLDVALQPYQRQVMDTLAKSMSAVHQMAVVAELGPTTSHLNESVGAGVSHELCAALADALELDAVGELSVSFSWASSIPWHREETTLSFPSDAARTVRVMAENLKDSPVVGEQRLIGFVRDFHRAEDDTEGRVIVRASVGGLQRSIRLHLSDDQYSIAATANDRRRSVFVKGTMAKATGRVWEFTNVTDFGMMEDLPIDELDRFAF